VSTDGSHAPMAFDSARALRAPASLNIVSSRPSCLLLRSCECELLEVSLRSQRDVRTCFCFFSEITRSTVGAILLGINKQRSTSAYNNPHNHPGSGYGIVRKRLKGQTACVRIATTTRLKARVVQAAGPGTPSADELIFWSFFVCLPALTYEKHRRVSFIRSQSQTPPPH
jgi:hypothetical protein